MNGTRHNWIFILLNSWHSR